jgi:hypothetical protein
VSPEEFSAAVEHLAHQAFVWLLEYYIQKEAAYVFVKRLED